MIYSEVNDFKRDPRKWLVIKAKKAGMGFAWPSYIHTLL